MRPIRLLLALAAGVAVTAAVPAPALALTFATIERSIEQRDVRSVEGLLAVLPASLRSRYALMFRSRSLHGASYDDPRVILYGDDARLIVTFNGDPALPGFGAVETLEFDPQTKTFALREIEFDTDPRAPAPARVSAPNPDRCLKCHGSPARPIWDTHPLWPGAYGERYRAPLSADEAAGLKRFLEAQPTHPRYRYLLDAARFADPETFHPGARSRYEGSEREAPNAELTTLLGRQNLESIASGLQARPQFERYQVALLAAIRNECDVEDAVPAGGAGASTFAAFARASAAADLRQRHLKHLRALGGTGELPLVAGAAAEESLARFRYVAERGFGVDTGGWTLALEKDTYDFTLPESSAGWFAGYFLNLIVERDPHLREVVAMRSLDPRDGVCGEIIRNRRRAATAAVEPVRAVTVATAPDGIDSDRGRPALLSRCASCHSQGVGPAIPFDRPTVLGPLLLSRPAVHGTLLDEIAYRLSPQAGAGRMPLGANPGDGERDALLDYLRGLSGLGR